MLAHHDARLIYVAHPAVASHSTKRALLGVGFVEVPRVAHHETVRHAQSPVVTSPASKGAPPWTVFGTVRNHWDAAADFALKTLSRKDEFGTRFDRDELIKRLHGWEWAFVQPDRMWSLHSADCHALWRFETLEQDVGDACERHGLPRPTLEHLNRTLHRQGRPVGDILLPDARAYIAERFAEEIAELGYTDPS